MKSVLVTGANGHLGFNLVQVLRERGYAVRAGVRNAADPARSVPLRALGAEVVEAELLDPESLRRAMEGMDGLFQNAAVYRFSPGADQEILDASLRGGENALAAAKAAGVRRVVYVSSCLATGVSRGAQPPRSESDWAEPGKMPYLRAKRDSEMAAWEFAKHNGLNMVTVLPGMIFGPGFQRHTPSTALVALLMDNRIPASPPMMVYPVDVRDVATATVQAYESPQATGRYLLTDVTLGVHEMAAHMRDLMPETKVPARLPRLFIPLVPVIDSVSAKLSGLPHIMTRAFLAEVGTGNGTWDSSRACAELGWRPRPLEETLRETLAWIREHNPSMEGV